MLASDTRSEKLELHESTGSDRPEIVRPQSSQGDAVTVTSDGENCNRLAL